jgi:hypothetical protein
MEIHAFFWLHFQYHIPSWPSVIFL